MRQPDPRPLQALAAATGLLFLVLAVPATRAWLAFHVGEPLRAQADPEPGLQEGYSPRSLAFWALLGALLAWAAFELVYVRLGVRPDRRFFLGIAPFLVLGPGFHALLVAGEVPHGTILAYLAAEPLIYVTVAVLAVAGLLAGRRFNRPDVGMLGVGLLALAPVLGLLLVRAGGEGLRLAAILLGLALAAALPLAWLYHRLRPAFGFGTLLAVLGAHALDGSTTWMVLRDPFHLGFEGYGERNPVSLALVGLGNGWPFFALKLALPLVLLSLVKAEEGEEDLHAFLLFAVFVLGFGPGMSNLLQVVLS